jgi:hypothetical protein
VTFPTPEIARSVTEELGSITLAASGWHVYANMEHLIERRTGRRPGLPVRLRLLRQRRGRLPAGMLPRTDALLARSMSIGIGIFDTNLAPWGLRMRDDAAAAHRVAERFCEVAGTVPGRLRVRWRRAGRSASGSSATGWPGGPSMRRSSTRSTGCASRPSRPASPIARPMPVASTRMPRSSMASRRSLERPDVEVVVVASPNHTHVPFGIAALEAGRHVVTDKPIATDVRGRRTAGRGGRAHRPDPDRLPEPAASTATS